MPKLSAGVLLYRVVDGLVEVLIVHPGGPFWARRDDGSWSIPKGEYELGEPPWDAARREFAEELGSEVPDGPRVDLGEVRQSGKVVTAFAVGGDLDVSEIRCNTFELEWPRGSGRLQEFPEVDRAAWLPVAAARLKLLKGQQPLLDRLLAHLDA